MNTAVTPTFRPFTAALLALMAAVCLHADLIDRIAVAVGRSVITESEIMRQIRITALLNGEKPDLSPENKRRTADRLVEQALIRREIAISQYLGSTSGGIEATYSAFRKRWKTEAEYRKVLEAANLTDTEIRDAFRWQLTLMDFIALRFRPGVQVSDEEIREYYDQQVANKGDVSFDEARPGIEEALTEERVNAALDRWLGQTRTQTRIIYKEDVYQ
jgi:hypothetical protein